MSSAPTWDSSRPRSTRSSCRTTWSAHAGCAVRPGGCPEWSPTSSPSSLRPAEPAPRIAGMDSAAHGGLERRSKRDLEEGIQRDFTRKMSYGDYLRLDTLLSAQQPLSEPPQHDELLFIIQHQTSELWLKLLIHELRSARSLLKQDALAPALKRLARVKHIQHTLTDQWSVLATLTPSEYAEIRPFLAASSGFQSAQYREVEFLLGNKNADMVAVFSHDEGARAALDTLLHEPSLYDEFLAYLARQGYAIPTRLLDRDWSQPYTSDPDLV